jgi:glycerol-3-phosphate acyltransferase PlsY
MTGVIFWSLIGFLCGSIPFSVLIGRWAGIKDIRQYGDHNPGGTNVIRATNWRWGAVAILLDGFKAAIPIGICWFLLGYHGWSMVIIALAPVFGHAFTPWLKGRGGKAVASTFGMWTGLTIFVSPIILGLLLFLFNSIVVVSGWAVLLTFLSFGGFIRVIYGSVHPEFAWIWLGNLALLIWKHRHDLKQPPGLRPWFLKLLGRKSP